MKNIWILLLALGLTACEEGTTAGLTEDEQASLKKGCLDASMSQTESFKTALGEENFKAILNEYCDCAVKSVMDADIPISEWNEMPQKDRDALANECRAELMNNLGAIE